MTSSRSTRAIAAVLALSTALAPLAAAAQTYQYKRVSPGLTVTPTPAPAPETPAPAPAPAPAPTGAGELSFETPALSFGEVAVGTSQTVTALLTNTGTADAALSFGGLPSGVTRGGSCGALLEAQDTCEVALTYTPEDGGNLSGGLTVSSGSSSATLSFSGEATTTADFSLSATSVNFGTVVLGFDANRSVLFSNTGTAALTLNDISVSGAGFEAVHDCPAVLARGASCYVTVGFVPNDVQSFSGTLRVEAAGLPEKTVSLSGSGQLTGLVVDGSYEDFGSVNIGSAASHAFTVTNQSSTTSASLSYTATAAPFSRGGTCGATLAPLASCTVVISFAPTTTSPVNGSVVVSGGGSSLGLAYAGKGVTFSLSPASLSFGQVPVGETSTKTLTLTNDSNVALTGTSIGLAAAGFSGSHNCPSTLAVGASCTLSVTFTPLAAQSYPGALTLNFGNATGRSVSLSGTGTLANLVASATSHAFGTVTVGGTASKTITVTNTGGVAAELSYSTLSGPYSRTGGTCADTLAPSASCTVIVKFAPVSGVYSTASYVVSAEGTSATVSFSGTGGTFALSATALAFGSVDAGTTKSMTVTVSNPSTLALTTPSVSVSGTGYSASHDCPATLSTAGSCTVTVTWAPTTAETRSGSASISFSNAAAKSVSLSATGLQAILSLNTSALGFNQHIGKSQSLTAVLYNTGNKSATLSKSMSGSTFFTQSYRERSPVLQGLAVRLRS